MFRSIFSKAIHDHQRGIIIWSIALAGLAIWVTYFYPLFGSNQQFNELLKNLPAAAKATIGEAADFATPAGFLSSELFFLNVPVFALIITILYGGAATAQEEEQGTLELLLANPIRRTTIVLQKFFFIAVALAVILLIFFAGLIFGIRIVHIDINLWHVAQAVINVYLLGLSFGTLTLAVGAATGKRAVAGGVSGGLAAVSFFVNTFGNSVQKLKVYQKVSLFYYYNGNKVIAQGLQFKNVLIFVAVTVVFLIAAVYAFNRRGLAV